MVVPRLKHIADLSTAAGLGALLGPVAGVERAPLAGAGRSGSALERLRVRLATGAGRSGSALERLRVRLATGAEVPLVLKRTRLAEDLVAAGTGDALGREAALLAEPALGGVWAAFACPYRAWATADGEIALLMDDLSPDLVPDDRPLTAAQEDALLEALARLHARYWQSDALRLPWLTPPLAPVDLLSPATAERRLGEGPSPLYEWVREGWSTLRARAPGPVVALLDDPERAIGRAWAGLPRTLLHGDVRLVNAAFPNGRAALVDWQFTGPGPATCDLGCYLIGNPGRRARAPEAVIARYRGFLEAELGRAVPDDRWARLLDAGLLYNAARLLWDRALDLADEAPGAAAEWRWWIDRLARPAARAE